MNSAPQDPRRTRRPQTVEQQDIQVLIADDHQTLRDALRDLIAATPGFVLSGQACSGQEAVDAVEALSPDLVLMDIVMPGMEGVAATQAILKRRPDATVVLISVNDAALSDAASTLGDAVVCVRKEDLRPSKLRQLWESRGKPQA